MHHYHYQRTGQTWNMYSLVGLGLGGPAGQVCQLVRSTDKQNCCYRSCSEEIVWLLRSLRLFHVLRTRAILTMGTPSTGTNGKQNKGTMTSTYYSHWVSPQSLSQSYHSPSTALIFKCRTPRVFGKIKTNHPSTKHTQRPIHKHRRTHSGHCYTQW